MSGGADRERQRPEAADALEPTKSEALMEGPGEGSPDDELARASRDLERLSAQAEELVADLASPVFPIARIAAKTEPGGRALCGVEGCGRKHFGRGYCRKHYQEVRSYGGLGWEAPCHTCGETVPPGVQRGTKFCSLRCRNLNRRFGITAAVYDELIRGKDACDGCGRPGAFGGTDGSSLVVDHCHASGSIRGLLHKNCNQALGQLKDDPNRLRGLAVYLRTAPGIEAVNVPALPRLSGCRWCAKALVLRPGCRPGELCPGVCQRYAHKLWSRFRLRVEQVRYMLETQLLLCAACAVPLATHRTARRYPVDHSHTTGRIRGIVHDSCNSALGLLNDDPERAELLAAYLEASTVPSTVQPSEAL